MKKILTIALLGAMVWVFFHHSKPNWQGQLAPDEPVQNSYALPAPWLYKDFTVTPRASYRITAVLLSKHRYWMGEVEDTLSSYDLALGWGPMSNADVINQLVITQYGRWYTYQWKNSPPIPLDLIISHSSNNHIIAADQTVLDVIKHFKWYDIVHLDGYLVDIKRNSDNWSWHTSLSRTDSDEGSCELFWVTNAFST